MKKILTTLLLVLSVSVMALAVPAYPGKYKYTQPDGSVLVLQNHGDEYFSWTTDESGRIVEIGEDGFFRPVDPALHKARLRKASKNAIDRRGMWASYDNHPATNFGDQNILCILVEFPGLTDVSEDDIVFTSATPEADFSKMLNQVGYSANGAIGSVYDYYYDNSEGQYRPHFDVFGPVMLSNPVTYYFVKGSTNRISQAIKEAYDSLKSDPTLDINKYDNDNDGDIDMVLLYFAGYNQAEGAPNTIWPHQSNGNFGTIGSKSFNRYFCTSELRGTEGANMCSIGTTCHEFAHSLGLPDFYDTDYEESGGKNSFTTGRFDLMSNGNYNDNGRKPPYMSALERNMLGWKVAPSTLEAGNYEMTSIRSGSAYMRPARTPGEYFIFEVRDNYKWDGAIPDYGLLVYHVDKSSNIVPLSGQSAAFLWEYTNSINCYYGHPCYLIIQSGSESHYAYPGAEVVSTYQPLDWDGKDIGIELSGIAFDGTKVNFTTTVSTDRLLFGTVTDTNGLPVANAQIVLSQSIHPFSITPLPLASDTVVETDANGYYEFALPAAASQYQILTVRKDGFIPLSVNVPASDLFINRNFSLYRKDEGSLSTLQRYNPDLNWLGASFGDHTTVGAAFRYSAEEIAAMGLTGHTIESVSFLTQPAQYEKVYIVIDFGGERALLQDVTDSFSPGAMNKIILSNAGITIPADKDVYIGYGITGLATNDYFASLYGVQTEWNDGTYINYDFLTGSTWNKTFNSSGSYCSFMISALLSEKVDVEFGSLGVASVKLEGGVPTVDAPAGKTVYSTQWYVDGTPVATPTAIADLSAGDHVYKVRLSYYDGTAESVYYDVHK